MDATTALPTGTVTFLFTDIEDGGAAFWPRSGQRRGPGPGTRLWEQQPRAMREALAQHDALPPAAIESHKGHRRESDLEREKHGV